MWMKLTVYVDVVNAEDWYDRMLAAVSSPPPDEDPNPRIPVELRGDLEVMRVKGPATLADGSHFHHVVSGPAEADCVFHGVMSLQDKEKSDDK